MTNLIIPFNKYNSFYLEHRDELINITDKVLSSGKYIRDEHVEIFEQNLAKFCKRKYAITTNSCTNAIFLALKSIGIKEGDEIILPAFSYIASLSPILMCGATPVFVDVDPIDLMIDINKIEDAISKKTKAVLFVQLFGTCYKNFEQLKKIANHYNLTIIEDAAQALGAKHENNPGGSFGDISCVSFDPTKIISAYGTGGAVLTNNPNYYLTVKKLINHGQNENKNYETLGYNSKISSLSAALLNFQLNNIENIIRKMNNVAEQYTNELNDLKAIKFVTIPNYNQNTCHKFVILAEKRDELRDYLLNSGIETKIHYNKSLCEHELLENYKFINNNISVANNLKTKVLSLPIYPNLLIEEIDYICKQIIKSYKNHNRL